MDDDERTASNPIESPADLLDVLRDIAVEAVERAAARPDLHRNDDARQELWNAVVLWGRITYCEPYASEIASLAGNAIEHLREPDHHPLKATDRGRLAMQREHLTLLERLMDLRDEATAQAALIRAEHRAEETKTGDSDEALNPKPEGPSA